jgi:uncharacterized lipoprotein YmbA
MPGLRAIATLAALAALTGCASSPQEQFYTLSAEAPAGAAPPAGAAYSVAVGPATVPEAVDRPQLVLRVGTNQVEVVEGHRWADPPKTGIPQTIAQDLARELGTPQVWAYPAHPNREADYRVALDVQRFDSALGDAATVEVLWWVRRGRDGTPRAGRSTVREPAAGGYAALVAAHSRALAAVSRDIAEAIRTLEAGGR